MRKPQRSTDRPQHAKRNWTAFLELSRIGLCAFFIFTLPLLYSVYNTDMSTTKYAYALLMISLLYALWGVQAWFDKEHDVCLPALFWPGLLFVAAGALSTWGATSIGVTLKSLSALAYFGLFYVYVANAAHNRQRLLLYLGAALLAALCVGVYAALQFYGVIPRGSLNARLIASLGNPNAVAEYLDSLLLAGLILFLGATMRWAKLVWFFALVVSLVALYLAGSAGAWLGLLSGIMVVVVGWLWFADPGARFKRWTTLVVTLVVVVLFLLGGQASTPRPPAVALSTASSAHTAALLPSVQSLWQPLVAFWQSNSGGTRLFFWQIGLEMFKSNPLFGVGLGHYAVRFPDFAAPLMQTELGRRVTRQFLAVESDNINIRAKRAHNDYVQVAAEMGLLGIVALLTLLVVFVWSGIAQLRRAQPRQRLTLLLLVAGVVALATDALVNFPMHLPASALNAVLLLGLAHSRYLRPASRVFRLRAGALRLAVLAVVAVGVTVSAFDTRDWYGNVQLERGKIYLDNALDPMAQQAFERSLSLSFQPGEALYYLGVLSVGAHPQQARAYFEASLHSFVFEDTLWRLANLYFQAQQYERARRELKRLGAMLPDPELFAKTRYLDALVDIRTGHVQEAVATAQASLASNPELGDMYLVLGEAALAQKAYDRALEAYRRALQFIKSEIANLEQVSAQDPSPATADALNKRTQQRDQILKLLDQLSKNGG